MNRRLTIPVLTVAGLALSLGGTSYALAAQGDAPAPRAGTAATSPVSDLLAGSYAASYDRLSVTGTVKIKNRKLPTVIGKPSVGREVAVTPGTWSQPRVKIRYQWYAGSAAIRGATDSFYLPTAKVLGTRLSVVVVASKSGYKSATAVTAPTSKVKPGRITMLREPVVTGRAALGKVLTASAGRWSVRRLDVDYQWLRGRRSIPGADDANYRLVRADVGTRLTVIVTVSRDGYTDAEAMTERTGVVTRR